MAATTTPTAAAGSRDADKDESEEAEKERAAAASAAATAATNLINLLGSSNNTASTANNSSAAAVAAATGSDGSGKSGDDDGSNGGGRGGGVIRRGAGKLWKRWKGDDDDLEGGGTGEVAGKAQDGSGASRKSKKRDAPGLVVPSNRGSGGGGVERGLADTLAWVQQVAEDKVQLLRTCAIGRGRRCRLSMVKGCAALKRCRVRGVVQTATNCRCFSGWFGGCCCCPRPAHLQSARPEERKPVLQEKDTEILYSSAPDKKSWSTGTRTGGLTMGHGGG